MDPYLKKLLVIGVLVVVGIAAIFIGLRGRDPNAGKSIEYSDPTGPAILNNSESLYETVGNSKSIDSFRKGLGEYSRNTLKIDSTDIVFVVSDATRVNNTVTVEGKFSGYKDLIIATIEIKNNGIIELKIENSKKDELTSTELTVNNKEDQFIGSLPVERDAYYLSYSTADSLYIVELKEYIENANELVEKDFEANIGRTPVRYEEYIILPPPKQINAP